MASRYDELMWSRRYMPCHVGRLTEELAARAEAELNETDEVRARALHDMRRLVLEDRRLRCPTDDAWLLQFLRARKFCVKKAASLNATLWELKRDYAEIFSSFDREAIIKLMDKGAAYCLPYRGEDGCPVLVFQTRKWNPDEVSLAAALSGMTFCMFWMLDDPATQVTGVHVILDVKSLSFKQVRCITPRYLLLISKALRNTTPMRFKGIHIYNESGIFQYLWAIFKVFISEKIQKRIHFHGDSQKSLHKYIPKCLLDPDYGGDNANFNAVDWCHKHLLGFMDTFGGLFSQGYSEQ